MSEQLVQVKLKIGKVINGAIFLRGTVTPPIPAEVAAQWIAAGEAEPVEQEDHQPAETEPDEE